MQIQFKKRRGFMHCSSKMINWDGEIRLQSPCCEWLMWLQPKSVTLAGIIHPEIVAGKQDNGIWTFNAKWTEVGLDTSGYLPTCDNTWFNVTGFWIFYLDTLDYREKDLGILVENSLAMSWQYAPVAKEANGILEYITRSMARRSR